MVIGASGENGMAADDGNGHADDPCSLRRLQAILASTCGVARRLSWHGRQECIVSNGSFSVIANSRPVLYMCCDDSVPTEYWKPVVRNHEEWVMYERAGFGRDAGKDGQL